MPLDIVFLRSQNCSRLKTLLLKHYYHRLGVARVRLQPVMLSEVLLLGSASFDSTLRKSSLHPKYG